MVWWLSAAVLFGAFTALFAVGLPAAFAFFGINVVGAWIWLGKDAGLVQMIRNGVASIASFSLTPIPFFVLMGEVLFHTGVAMKAIDAIDRMIWKVPGRLSVVAVVAGTVFSAISGSTIATTALLGSLLLPQMLARGYHPSMAMGPIMAIGGVDMLIPPSALTGLLGSLAGISISQLLGAGIIPRVLLSGGFVGWVGGLDGQGGDARSDARTRVRARRHRRLGTLAAAVRLRHAAGPDLRFGDRRDVGRLGDADRVGGNRRDRDRRRGLDLPFPHAVQSDAGTVGDRCYIRDYPVHHRRRDHVCADPHVFGRDQRAGEGDRGGEFLGSDGTHCDDGDPARPGLLHRSSQHDADHAAVFHAAGAVVQFRPAVVRRDVPDLHATRAADAALRDAAVNDEKRRAQAHHDEPGLSRGDALRRLQHPDAGHRDAVPAGGDLAAGGAVRKVRFHHGTIIRG